jgi:ribosomal protein RSM22 (predicted rRNA methylase)
MQLPSALRQAIEREHSCFDAGRLARATRELSDQYSRGDFRQPPLASAEHRMAYVEARLPATYAANLHAMSEVAKGIPDFAPRTFLDLGAGPGTAMWAAAEIFSSLCSFTLLEHDRGIADLGERLAASSPFPAMQQAAWVREDVNAFRLPAHDIVVISYLLGELGPAGTSKLVARAWEATRQLLLVIEPGTPRNFQTVLGARESLIAAGGKVAAPCPHHESCPLAAKGDWCHFAARVERSAAHRRLKGGTLSYEDEKFSYLAVSRVEAAWPSARIVRHPLFRPGHVQLSLCTAGGIQSVTVGKSQKERYRGARQARWGDAWE